MTEHWWERKAILAALVLVTAVPLLWPAIPPLLDLPGHMGRYAVSLGGGEAPIARYYDYQWALLGNLGVDLIVTLLGRWIEVETATKLTVLAIPMLMSAGFLWVTYEVHGKLQATTPLALVFCYAYPFHYGFVNYALGMAFVALAFPLWIRWSNGPAWRRSAVFAAIAAVIWVTHAIAWLALCVLCFAFELFRRLKKNEPIPRALLQTILSAVPLGTGAVLTLLSASGAPGTIGGVFDVGGIAKALISLNRDRWIAIDLLTSAVLLAILALALCRFRGLAVIPDLGWPAFGLLALFIAIPDSVNDSAYLKTRLLPWAVAYALLAIKVPVSRDIARWAALSFGVLLLRLSATAASLLAYDASYASTLRALDLVPKGSRIATFTVNACRPTLANWTNSRRQHLGGIAVIRRNAFVNDQFEAGSLQLLRVRYASAGTFRHSPSEVVSTERCVGDYPPLFADRLDALPRDAFDFVWLLDVPRSDWPSRPWLRPVYDDGATILYAVKRSTRESANR
ncbi:hypothetical protein ACFSC3_11075 [Sphingomonas floccifaciens]|uniref:Glucosyl transferase GtrII n=1 Tax=Sphingomonas floccifaciens TaxID=1844115 RepID=A0ABW4NEY3_9SPHN